MMRGKLLLMVSLILLAGALLHSEASACEQCGCNTTYNGYCSNQRWGWYGARKSVSSLEEARRDLTEYYADRDVQVGKIVEKTSYYEAVILDRNKKPVDRVIIHKRSGRIRSVQ
ncbi:hypothetical protein GSU3563 [Geobacter sulfurreducens PCA]|uniref:PepSY domain-containing protein n=1 Tax=Geobacter sulfurreducens (strain ATCC 51573 / DSM 12127 / PCA) TaxID=243231 RepID=I7EF17_GEOSL|nr:hypothetical protein GSU3563 [Geobacter sulfurreducens PCA]